MTAWDTGSKPSTIDLTNANLTAKQNGASRGAVRGSVACSGLKRWEVTINTLTSSLGTSVAICNTSMSLTGILGTTNDAIAYYNNGQVYINSTLVTTYATFSAGDVIGVHEDDVNKRLWFRVNGGSHNGGGGADPATNTGGLDVSVIGTVYPAFSTDTMNDQVTANFGASVFSFAAASGFSSFDNALATALRRPFNPLILR